MKTFILIILSATISKAADFSNCKINDALKEVVTPIELNAKGEIEIPDALKISRVFIAEKETSYYVNSLRSTPQQKMIASARVERDKKGQPVLITLESKGLINASQNPKDVDFSKLTNAIDATIISYKYINDKCTRTAVVHHRADKKIVAYDLSLCEKLATGFAKVAIEDANWLSEMTTVVDRFREQFKSEKKELLGYPNANPYQDALLRSADCRRDLMIK